MLSPRRTISLPALLLTASFGLFAPRHLSAEPVTVRYQEGTLHGFLTVHSADGKQVATGDLYQTIKGGQVTTRLVYRFKDGSTDDDTAVFTQRGHFHLISDHHVQKGPAFETPMDLTIQAATGMVTVHYQEKGEEKVAEEHMDLPPDLANGLLLDLLKNLPAETPETRLSCVATTPKPRLVHLVIKPAAKETFTSGGAVNKAVRFQIHVDIGGITGKIAPLVGKEPPDSNVWISNGLVPAFVRSETQLYVGGPVIRTELVDALWPEEPKSAERSK